MRRFACLGLVALGSCAAPSTVDPERAAGAYRACAGGELLDKADNVSWAQRDSLAAEHRTLRSRLGVDLPEAPRRILLFSAHAHHTKVDHSLVAVRRPDGIWSVDHVGEERGGLLAVEPKALPRKAYALSAAQSRQVDALLEDPCLYPSPTFLRDPDIVAGGVVQTLEVESPRRGAILTWLGTGAAQAEQLVKLLLR